MDERVIFVLLAILGLFLYWLYKKVTEVKRDKIVEGFLQKVESLTMYNIVFTEKNKEKSILVRLYGVDESTKSQRGEQLQNNCIGRYRELQGKASVRFQFKYRDSQGYYIGVLRLLKNTASHIMIGEDIAETILKNGIVRYRKERDKNKDLCLWYQGLEAKARMDKEGIWKENN